MKPSECLGPPERLEEPQELVDRTETPTMQLAPQSQLTGKKPAGPRSIADVALGRTLGVGAFGRVRLATCRGTGDVYALKCLKKHRLIETQQVKSIFSEKDILLEIAHPFVVNLFSYFQDRRYLYFALEFVQGGEFFHHLGNVGCLPSAHARFYAGCIVSVFAYMHERDIIYRDLKPENMLLHRDGYLKLADFGAAKFLSTTTSSRGEHGDSSSASSSASSSQRSQRTNSHLRSCFDGPEDGSYLRTDSFLGTPEYIAPELLLNRGHGKPVDWWTLGILIFEMVTGKPPICDEDEEVLVEERVHSTLASRRSARSSRGSSRHHHGESQERTENATSGRDFGRSESLTGCGAGAASSDSPRRRLDYPMSIYQRILGKEKIRFPRHFDPHAKDLVKGLLTVDLERRLGGGQSLETSVAAIRNHAWFRAGLREHWDHSSCAEQAGSGGAARSQSGENCGEEWFKLLEAKVLAPPFLPQIRDKADTASFVENYDETEPEDVPPSVPTDQDPFRSWD